MTTTIRTMAAELGLTIRSGVLTALTGAALAVAALAHIEVLYGATVVLAYIAGRSALYPEVLCGDCAASLESGEAPR